MGVAVVLAVIVVVAAVVVVAVLVVAGFGGVGVSVVMPVIVTVMRMVMAVFVPMVMTLPMSVIVSVAVRMAVVVPMAMSARRVRATLGLERRLLRGDDEVHGAQHVGEHVVGFDLQVVGSQLDRHVAVAQVVGGADEVEGRAVLRAVGDAQDRLGRGDHADHAAVFGHQHVAAAHDGAAGQEDAEFAPGGVGGGEAAFLAHVPVEFDGGGALEQYGREAVALEKEFVGGQHVGVLGGESAILRLRGARWARAAGRGLLRAGMVVRGQSARVMKWLAGSSV